ncbi:hypothetical protein ACFC09_26935 [Streptomyces sp. NPDC056161]|uniref:hypothetical protein n=1 Tax=Streptomyces sp. NPDC056161 TaxID=3345732 RepID=UPI0035DDB4EC
MILAPNRHTHGADPMTGSDDLDSFPGTRQDAISRGPRTLRTGADRTAEHTGAGHRTARGAGEAPPAPAAVVPAVPTVAAVLAAPSPADRAVRR